jgi:hypothetical protein
MKSFKLVMPVLAFVLAMASAVASDNFLLGAKGKSSVSPFPCLSGTLINTENCQIATSGVRCRVIIPKGDDDSEIVDAFAASGTCSTSPTNEALYYQP